MKRYYVLLFFVAITIPFFFGLNIWQSNECGIIRNEIKQLEKSQENYVKENKTVAHEIGDLLATGRLEAEAKNMGLRKMRPEDVTLIIMEGERRGH